MTVQYDIEALQALKILYGDTTCGYPEEDFRRNEQERGIYLPDMLCRFLMDYGDFVINYGEGHMQHPDEVESFTLEMENGQQTFLHIGWCLGDKQVAIAADDFQDDPFVCRGEMGLHDTMMWTPSQFRLSGILKLIFCFNLLDILEGELIQDPDSVEFLCEQFGVTMNPEMERPQSLRTSICWDADHEVFLILIPVLRAIALVPVNDEAEAEFVSN